MKVNKYIYRAPIIFISDSFYVVGGFSDISMFDSTIGKLDGSLNWSKAGELLTGRRSHNIIYNGKFLFIIGGFAGQENVDLKIEKCDFYDDRILCAEQSLSLYEYYNYPELFLISAGFCRINE